MSESIASLAALKAQARTVLEDALGGEREVAFVNFPNHGNPGDPLIWLGTLTLLREMGVKVGYYSASWDFDPKHLRSRVGNAPVLINGGGNFGDLYQGQQSTRVRVLQTLGDNRIIQMPQSIFFSEPENADAMAKLISSHGGFDLIVRERISVERAINQLGITPRLSPDHALGYSQLATKTEPSVPILWNSRRPGDPEYVAYQEPTGNDVNRIEWLEGIPEHEATWPDSAARALKFNRKVRASWNPDAFLSGLTHRRVEKTYEPLALQWVQRGADLLGSAKVVITDKLHGHIMCSLLGIPHVVLDNSYGKVSGTLDAWTKDLPGVHVANSGEEALSKARTLVEEL